MCPEGQTDIRAASGRGPGGGQRWGGSWAPLWVLGAKQSFVSRGGLTLSLGSAVFMFLMTDARSCSSHSKGPELLFYFNL